MQAQSYLGSHICQIGIRMSFLYVRYEPYKSHVCRGVKIEEVLNVCIASMGQV